MQKEVLFTRVSLDLKEQLQAAAKANGRTLTGEIVQRLKASFEGYRKL